MIRGTLSNSYVKVDPVTYAQSEEEQEISQKIASLENELSQTVGNLRRQIASLQDSCQHKVFLEFDENTNKQTWLGVEIKKHYRCAICNAEFLDYWYRMSV